MFYDDIAYTEKYLLFKFRILFWGKFIWATLNKQILIES